MKKPLNRFITTRLFEINRQVFKQLYCETSQEIKFININDEVLMSIDSFGFIYSDKKELLGKLLLRNGKWIFESKNEKTTYFNRQVQNKNQESLNEFQRELFIKYWKKKMSEPEVYSTIDILNVEGQFYQQVIFYMTDDRVEFLDKDRKPVMVFDCHCNAFLLDDQKKRVQIGKINLRNNSWVFDPNSDHHQYLVCSKPDKGPEPIIELERDIFKKYWENKHE